MCVCVNACVYKCVCMCMCLYRMCVSVCLCTQVLKLTCWVECNPMPTPRQCNPQGADVLGWVGGAVGADFDSHQQYQQYHQQYQQGSHSVR